ncbi:hypothetical protein D3C72_2249200 [compost metagenome]
MLFQGQHGGHFQAKDVAVGIVVREHDAAVRNRPAVGARVGQQVPRLRDGLGYVAAAQHGRVGKAVDEVHDQQAKGRFERQRRAEALARIGGDIARDGVGGNGLG